MPAQVQGRWCGRAGVVLDLTQQYQQVRMNFGGALPAADARLRGATLDAGTALSLRVIDGRVRQLRVSGATGAWSALAGARFVAAGPSGCER